MTEKTTTCPQCKEEIIKGAKKCKHCGADLRNRFTKHPFLTLLLCMFVFGPFLGGIFSSMNPNQTNNNATTSSTPPQQVETFKKDGIEVCIYAQQWVEDEIKPLLKDPSSLELPTCSNDPENKDHTITRMPDGGVLYQSYYISKNALKAKIKKEYTCAIQYQSYPNYTTNCAVIEE